jgi:hypothetical protein
MEECTYFWGVNTSWGINTAERKDLCIRKIIKLHNQQVVSFGSLGLTFIFQSGFLLCASSGYYPFNAPNGFYGIFLNP